MLVSENGNEPRNDSFGLVLRCVTDLNKQAENLACNLHSWNAF